MMEQNQVDKENFDTVSVAASINSKTASVKSESVYSVATTSAQ